LDRRLGGPQSWSGRGGEEIMFITFLTANDYNQIRTASYLI